MKKKIIGSLLSLSLIGISTYANAQVQQGGDIVYQNQSDASSVNTTPQGSPQGIPQGNNSQQYQDGVQTTYQNGQKVRTTTEVQRIDRNNNTVTQQVDYSNMNHVQKFWNVPNSTIRQVRQKYEERERLLNQDLSPARCDNKRGVVNVGENPGSDFPLIRLDGRNIATILMTDVYSKPWPIDYIINQEADISVIRDEKDPNVSSFSVNALTNHAQGNFVVKLKDNPVPVVFSFITNQKEVDCLLVAKLDKPSPDTDIKTETLRASAMDNSLNSTLYGVAPKGGRSLKVSDNSATVWLLEDGKVAIRTKYKLLAPAPISMTRSPDGTFVYKVQYSPSYTYRYNDLISSFTVTK